MDEVERYLEAVGVDEVSAVEAVTGGADAALWRVTTGGVPYALRVLPPGRERQAASERRFLRHATDHGIVGPRVIAESFVDGRAVTLMTWIDGTTLSAAIFAGGDATSFGRQFGAWQRRIHALPLPPDVDPGLRWGTPVDEDLVAALRAIPPLPPTVVHLDFHPMNCMVRDGQIVAVLDWANAAVADPRYDIARTLAILDALPLPDAASRARVETFRDAGLDAYGDVPLPPVFRWWARDALYRDLLPRRNAPSIPWLTDAWFDSVQEGIDDARREATGG